MLVRLDMCSLPVRSFVLFSFSGWTPKNTCLPFKLPCRNQMSSRMPSPRMRFQARRSSRLMYAGPKKAVWLRNACGIVSDTGKLCFQFSKFTGAVGYYGFCALRRRSYLAFRRAHFCVLSVCNFHFAHIFRGWRFFCSYNSKIFRALQRSFSWKPPNFRWLYLFNAFFCRDCICVVRLICSVNISCI